MHAPTEITPALQAVASAPPTSKEPTGLGCLVIVARHHGMHLTVPQLIRDNVLTGDEVSSPQIVHCARLVGLKAKEVQLNWDGLAHLKKALPVIARLKSGQCMVVLRVEGEEGEGETLRVILQDPNAHEDAPLVIDRVRFEEAWTGDIILVKRNYDIADETQPFSIRFIAALIFRERWIVRDLAICALVLGFLSLTPILFWRVLSDKVIYYKAFDTFYVICAGDAGFHRVRDGVRLAAAISRAVSDHAGRCQDFDLRVRQGDEFADGFFRADAGRQNCLRHESGFSDFETFWSANCSERYWIRPHSYSSFR